MKSFDAVEKAAPVSLTPEQVVEQLRTLQAQVSEIVPLTAKQRSILREQTRVSPAVVQASINVIGASDSISQAVGQPATDVRQMVDEADRWTAVEAELRAALNGVTGANLVRRQRIALITTQAYQIGQQLVRDPGHAELLPHLLEVKRLRRLSSRKNRVSKSATASRSPEPLAADEMPQPTDVPLIPKT